MITRLCTYNVENDETKSPINSFQYICYTGDWMVKSFENYANAAIYETIYIT